MSTVRIIPCLDVAEGKVVKGVNFEGLKEVGDPITLAKQYYEDGADELTFLDVAATVNNRYTTYQLATAVAEQVFIPLTIGGGVRSAEDAKRLIASGADKIGVNSAAVARPELITEIADVLGSQAVVVSVDAKRGSTKSGFEVTTHGGKKSTGIDALEWAKKAIDLGSGEILLNSIDADGTKTGFDIEMLTVFRKVSSVPLIASGGGGKPADFVAAAHAGADAVLAASVFHFGLFTIQDVKAEMRAAGIEVR